MLCVSCQSFFYSHSFSPLLCPRCDNQIGQLLTNCFNDISVGRIRSLYRYEGPVRNLIIRAKVKNDAVAAGLICLMARRWLALAPFDDAGLLIIPAPPSFWGRIRGRFDVAELLALSFRGNGPVMTGFTPQFAFRAKRAGRNAHETSRSGLLGNSNEVFNHFKVKPEVAARISAARRILVVDDVMTTGLTMRTIFNQLKELGAQSIEGLVFASPS